MLGGAPLACKLQFIGEIKHELAGLTYEAMASRRRHAPTNS